MTCRRSSFVALSIMAATLAMGLWMHNFNISSNELSELFVRLRWWPVLPLFCLIAGHVALASWRWSLIEVGLGGRRPRFNRAFTAGVFALGLGVFLPPQMVNIACRSLANRFDNASSLRGMLSGAIDQLADLAVVALVAAPALLALISHDLRLYLLGAAVMVMLGPWLILALPGTFRLVLLTLRILDLDRIAPLTDRPLLLKLYGISLLRVANLTLMTLAIHKATGTATVPAVVISVPLVTLAISVAMLPGGFGVSEWSFSAAFSSFGIARDDIVLFALANRIILTVLSLTLALLVLIIMASAQLDRARRPSPYRP